ncbi:MAG: Undecaprenyl-phosphate mannosyltransferase [candidate division BRC1 bacterium ADurb.BinA364]|nr:MAG: Undecaprenyl-phosphate mannosyltransferase [candidate division BRC1 bacterium ADurb.BinA364]
MGSEKTLRPSDCWVVVPAYNEKDAIGEVLDELLAKGYNVAVVDDGSSDGTFDEAAKRPVHLLRHIVNLGQGAALQTGVEYALRQGASYVVTMDADGQHCVEDIALLVEPLLDGAYDIALGTTRFRRRLLGQRMPRLRRWTLIVAAFFSRVHPGLKVTDAHNGLRAMSRQAASKLNIMHNGMAHATEMLDFIKHERLRWREVDVSIKYTRYSLSKGQHISNSFNIIWDWMLGKVR